MTRPAVKLIGVISDTHGLLRPEALDALRGVDRIIHAGDVGGAHLIDELEKIAPVSVVRGNNDRDAWGRTLPETIDLEIDGWRLHVLHNLAELNLNPVETNVHAVITGHSHKPVVNQQNKALFLNPGSAGPRRFSLPITLAHLTLGPDMLRASIIPLVSAAQSNSKRTRVRR
jgi:putative phosphoesterase